MLKNIKSQIKELAKNAVLVAEAEFGPGRGEEKKKRAIEYIVKNLPFSNLVKNILAMFLYRFIDNVVEISVKLMKQSLSDHKGE